MDIEHIIKCKNDPQFTFNNKAADGILFQAIVIVTLSQALNY